MPASPTHTAAYLADFLDPSPFPLQRFLIRISLQSSSSSACVQLPRLQSDIPCGLSHLCCPHTWDRRGAPSRAVDTRRTGAQVFVVVSSKLKSRNRVVGDPISVPLSYPFMPFMFRDTHPACGSCHGCERGPVSLKVKGIQWPTYYGLRRGIGTSVANQVTG